MPPKTPASGSSSQRLDSLNRRPGSAASSGSRSRFMPKAVARRSKEERDKTAPAEKPVVEEPKPSQRNRRGGGPGGSGRGGARGGGMSNRGGRGGRFQPAASVAAMGPFAAPGNVRETKRLTPSFERRETTPSYNTAQLRIKSETPGPSSGDSTPAPEEDDHRIDMTSNIPIESDIAAYFPIRLDRREDEDEEDMPPPPQSSLDADPAVAAAARDAAPDATSEAAHDDAGVKIKNEPTDDDVTMIPPPPPREKYISPQQKKELERIQLDHEMISDEFNIKASLDESKAKALEQRLYFFQFPAVLPQFDKEEGLGGHLRLHESGKLTMVLGDIVMEVSQGTECNFLQDVVVLDKPDKKAYLIGQVTRKMVVSPDMDRLLS